jgi:peptidoglycan biosynthesis protein MviN/MurJ (putative lipid II flippase)
LELRWIPANLLAYRVYCGTFLLSNVFPIASLPVASREGMQLVLTVALHGGMCCSVLALLPNCAKAGEQTKRSAARKATR